jgi:prepilin-type processing-associated H-X9-DG protein
MQPMNEAVPRFGGPDRASRRGAFTLVELLVVIGIVVLLASVQLPALAKVRHHTNVAQCAGNLRQVTMAYHIYGTENNDHLPATTAGSWAWDMPWNLATSLGAYGAPRTALYCPANPGQNVDGLWNFSPNSFRVIGYALTLTGGGSISSTNWNPTLTPQPIAFGPAILSPPLVSQRVLVADATLSLVGQNNEANRATYNYTSIPGGFSSTMRTSHVDRFLPAGGNLGMLDGHVEWRAFQQMHVRTPPAAGTPVFWW